MSSRDTSSKSGAILAAPSSIEYSVCTCRCTNELAGTSEASPGNGHGTNKAGHRVVSANFSPYPATLIDLDPGAAKGLPGVPLAAARYVVRVDRDHRAAACAGG